eukprot:TRINITY_DN9047_c0_g1_i1.p1 TRINITY_DN9047_c0_g1~~TRINITY_DN9047_c0_g1_i1.p1  ORF type:complete len:175 (-),score=57.23 TRINITY_DN9047_c0_g1_i1:108-557(-)
MCIRDSFKGEESSVRKQLFDLLNQYDPKGLNKYTRTDYYNIIVAIIQNPEIQVGGPELFRGLSMIIHSAAKRWTAKIPKDFITREEIINDFETGRIPGFLMEMLSSGEISITDVIEDATKENQNYEELPPGYEEFEQLLDQAPGIHDDL